MLVNMYSSEEIHLPSHIGSKVRSVFFFNQNIGHIGCGSIYLGQERLALL